jgi:hypothetical protein
MHAKDWASRPKIAPEEEHPKFLIPVDAGIESREKKALTGMLLARNEEAKEKGSEVIPSALTTIQPGTDGECYQYVNGELNPEWVKKYASNKHQQVSSTEKVDR